MAAALQGVRVLDLSRLLPGGFCSLLLADLGADVLKVEDTGMGDYVRWATPGFEGAEDSAKGALFLALNRNKRSVRLDLKSEAGREVLLRLARDHDVLLESFRPGVLDRLGVGWDALREVNPGLVYCAISGYGRTGPAVGRSGHDLNYLGLNGLLALTGERDGPPVQSGGQIADLGGGALMAAFGILAALRHRDATGEGQVVDVSMFDGALSWLAMVAGRVFAAGERPRRGGEALGGSLVCYRPYACADGWVTLGALEPKFWAAWCRGVGREDLIERQFEPPGSATHAEVEALFAGRTRAEWEGFAAQHDCCLEPVLELEEALASELVRAREMVISFEQPGAGEVQGLGFPVKLSATPGAVRRPGPALGEHTEEVLREAGYDDDGIAALLAAGAVAGPPAPPEPADKARDRFSHEPERPAQDERAGRALRREHRDDQALPARGAAGRWRRGRAHLAQHGVVPAGLRRARAAHQAPAGGALHAAEGHPHDHRGGGHPRTRAGRGRDRAAVRSRGPPPLRGSPERPGSPGRARGPHAVLARL